MKLIDFHCHLDALDLSAFDGKLEAVCHKPVED